MKKVLFVCTGNICRSPMAEAIFNFEAKNKGKDYVASSSGISVFFGERTSRNSIISLKELWGIDFEERLPNKTDQNIIDDSDLIITMTVFHKKYILGKFKNVNNKVFTLKEIAEMEGEDIEDPYEMSLEDYKQCAMEIKDGVDKLINKLQ